MLTVCHAVKACRRRCSRAGREVPLLQPPAKLPVPHETTRHPEHGDHALSWRVAAPGVHPGLRRAAAAAPPTAPAPTRSHRPRRRRILPRPGPQGLAGERGGDPGPSPFPSPGVGQALALTPTLFYAGCPGRTSCGAQGLPRDGTRPLRPVGEGVPRLTLALTLPRLSLTLTQTLTRNLTQTLTLALSRNLTLTLTLTLTR